MRTSSRPRSTSAPLSLSLSLLLAAAVPSAARADNGVDEDIAASDGNVASYRASIDRGTAAFRDGHFAEARAAFERAFAIYPEPVLLFNIASCWRRTGDATEAIAVYRRFLDVAPANDSRRALAETTIGTLEHALAPPSAPLPPLPASRSAVDPPVDQGEGDRPTSLRRPAAFGLIGLGTISLLACGAEAWHAHSISQEIEALDRGRRWDNGEAELYARGENASQWSVIFGASGALLAFAGITLWYTGDRDDHSVQVGAAPNAGGGEVVISGSF